MCKWHETGLKMATKGKYESEYVGCFTVAAIFLEHLLVDIASEQDERHIPIHQLVQIYNGNPQRERGEANMKSELGKTK